MNRDAESLVPLGTPRRLQGLKLIVLTPGVNLDTKSLVPLGTPRRLHGLKLTVLIPGITHRWRPTSYPSPKTSSLRQHHPFSGANCDAESLVPLGTPLQGQNSPLLPQV